jgi:hypothetical protein
MAEPEDRGSVSLRVTREVSRSRLERQLLVKVYALLIPVAQASCRLSPRPVKGQRSGHPIGNTSRIKGVRR